MPIYVIVSKNTNNLIFSADKGHRLTCLHFLRESTFRAPFFANFQPYFAYRLYIERFLYTLKRKDFLMSKKKKTEKLKVILLGGLNEVGKNINVF